MTFVGNLAADPELRFTDSGVAVCNFPVIVNGQRKDAAGEWQQESATPFRCTVWKDLAENASNSLAKGARVVVTGNVRLRPYETKAGDKGTSLDVDVTELGVSLRFVTVKAHKVARDRAA